MSEKKIITYGNPILRQKSEEVVEIDDEIRELAKKLEEDLATENGIGLAAPQIGILKRVFFIDLTKSKQPYKLALINPKIVYKSADMSEYEEGCLSVPNVWGNVYRPSHIKIKGKTISGKVVLIDAEGLYARVLQHEYDHLDGKLFIDYLSKPDLEKYNEVINALVEENKKCLGEVAL